MFPALIVVFCVMKTCIPLDGGCQCFGLVVSPPSLGWISSIKIRTEFPPKCRYTTYYLNQKHYNNVQNPSLDPFFSHINIVAIITYTHTHAHTHTHTIFFNSLRWTFVHYFYRHLEVLRITPSSSFWLKFSSASHHYNAPTPPNPSDRL